MLPLTQFIAYIKKNALFEPEDKILLAVSGGKDSVLMAQLFKLAGFHFSIAHCNFNLRGDESRRDESFVKLLAADLEVPVAIAHFNTSEYADTHQLSTQMAARELRYQWFEQLRQELNYDYIALAHHQNDSIETLLLNLVRGTGISGMHGILPKRDKLIRPLLFLSRQEIDQLIDENNISFVEDSSNESSKYARNRIRLAVMPQLQELNPKLEQTFVENMERFAETEELVQRIVAETRQAIMYVEHGDCHLQIAKIKELKPQKLLLFELLKPFNFSAHVVNRILASLDKQSGTSFYSSSHRATIDRETLIISPVEKKNEEHCLVHPQDSHSWIGSQEIALSYVEARVYETNPNKAYVDVAQLIFPLILRFRQDGDRFMPLGMRQFKKLSDFLIDEKVPLPQKERIPLLINGNGEIIWVAGLRQDNRYKVNATTKKVAIFELLNQ